MLHSQPPVGTLETIHDNTNEMEAVRLTNQRLIRELEQLTIQILRPEEGRLAQEDHNSTPQKKQPHLGPPREAEIEAESSRARGHEPYLPPRDGRHETILGGNIGNDEPTPHQQGMGERSWEQRFKAIQQELSYMKEVVKGRALDSMDTLVQQTESPFKVEVLHFPLPTKFRMPQIEAFDGAKDPVDHLNTYKNQIELNGYEDPVRCGALTITLKGPALAWFNRLPSSSISSFRELSIAFVSHFIEARTYRKSSYHFLSIKKKPQESLRSYVQRFNAESLKVDVPNEKFAIITFIAGLGVQPKDLMFSISKNPRQAWLRCSLKQRSTLTAKKPSYPREEALQPTRRKA